MSDISKSQPSVRIARVFPNITRKRIKNVIEATGLGTIDRIDMVNKTGRDGKKYKEVFIHFNEWASTEEANEFREALMKGEKREIDYEPIKNSTTDEWWYWRVEKSHLPKPDFSDKTKTTTTTVKTSPRIRTKKTSHHPGKAHPTATSGAGLDTTHEITQLKQKVFQLETQLGFMQVQMQKLIESFSPPRLNRQTGADECADECPCAAFQVCPHTERAGRVYDGSTTPEYCPSSPVYMPEASPEMPPTI